MAKGKLYGVSVGPGDPELITLKAARVLREADCIAAPALGGSARAALRIVEPYIQGKQVLDCASPMTSDVGETTRAYDVVAKAIAALLDEGKTVAFVTLGDASVYSSWSYACERIRALGYEVEVVAGVTSFNAAAALLAEPLCERSEQLHVIPASSSGAASALAMQGTKVFMKTGKRLDDLRVLLNATGDAPNSMLVANCGLEGEAVVRDLITDAGLPGGMAVVIVKDRASSGEGAELAEPHEAFADASARIGGPDEEARRLSLEKWDAVAKPLGSLGILEDDVMRIAALTGSPEVSIRKRAVVVLCADNGIVAEGVSQCGPEVTRSVAVSLGKGISSVCSMARVQGIDVVPVDIGMADPAGRGAAAPVEGVLDRRVASGTGNIAEGPAMTREQALSAIQIGIDLVAELKDAGYELLASGEMGIGNTTTSSAMTAALFGLPAAEVTGRGAGLDDEGLKRKVAAIERAIQVNAPEPGDVLDVLAKLGGFDIAGMAGLFIGGALHRVPVVVDGFISALSAYVAYRLCPPSRCAMFASHMSAEPAARAIMDALGLKVPIQAGMRLGEGTGAICLVPLLDMALSLYNGTTFDDSGIQAYEKLS